MKKEKAKQCPGSHHRRLPPHLFIPAYFLFFLHLLLFSKTKDICAPRGKINEYQRALKGKHYLPTPLRSPLRSVSWRPHLEFYGCCLLHLLLISEKYAYVVSYSRPIWTGSLGILVVAHFAPLLSSCLPFSSPSSHHGDITNGP